MLPRSKWKDKRYHKCMWCKEGISVQVTVEKVSDIENFLSIQKGVSKQSGPGYPDLKVKGEIGVSIDEAPID
jgi:hypothetical protein